MYAHESSMKLSFEGTLDTRTVCGALKKIKEFYMKRTKTFEYKTNKLGLSWAKLSHSWGLDVD